MYILSSPSLLTPAAHCMRFASGLANGTVALTLLRRAALARDRAALRYSAAKRKRHDNGTARK